MVVRYLWSVPKFIKTSCFLTASEIQTRYRKQTVECSSATQFLDTSITRHMPTLASRFLGLSFVFAMVPVAQSGQPEQPNVLLIMADDLGYSDLGCYGGEIDTPNLDKLAGNGIRFSQFYNTGRCWPTRASLLTGYYPHGIRRDKIDGTQSGNRGKRPRWAPLIVETLRQRGYRSYHTGKWHIDGMPIASGFDRSYYLKDQHRFFNPTLHWKDDQPLPAVPKGTEFYATNALGDHVVQCMEDHFLQQTNAPFFHYLAFAAPHFPLQALPEDIEKYRTRYQVGWQKIREERWNRIEAQGLVHGRLSDPMVDIGPPYDFPEALEILGPDEINRPVPWESLTPSQQEFQANKMAIHAAMIDRMDQQIGRIIQCLKDHQQFDNTIIFFLSDNGASAEIMVRGDGHDRDAPMGSADSHLCLGPGWSTASNTPFRYHKTWTHEGGTATPLIVHWPKGIQARGEVREQVGHVIDLWPTILELTTVEKNTDLDESNHPRPGRSLTPFFDRDDTQPRTLWWLHEKNRSLRSGEWKIAATATSTDWELYNLNDDRTETNDLINEHPKIAENLIKQWEAILKQQSDWAVESN